MTKLTALCVALSLAAASLRADDTNDYVPLVLKLPSPVFAGTPKAAPEGSTVDAVADKTPPKINVPRDVKNIAPGKKIVCSDKNVTHADLQKLTDGNKEAEGDDIVQLHKGQQWVQFDLGSAQEIYAIAFWHAHDIAKIFRAVIVQVADDEDFTANVRTLFNNDRDNSAGLGAGTDRQYFESFQGKLIDAKGAKARYVRLYSNGSTDSKLNEYTEVEIYARPAR